MTTLEWLAWLMGPSAEAEKLAWLAVFSVGMYLLAAAVRAGMHRPGRMKPWGARWRDLLMVRWAMGLGRLLYFVGIPYAALLRGLISLRVWGGIPLDSGIGVLGAFLGLEGPEVVLRWGSALLWAMALTLVWTGVWVWWRRWGDVDSPELGRVPWGRLLYEAFLWETHWLLYRGAALRWVGDPTRGAFLALGVIWLELGVGMMLLREEMRSSLRRVGVALLSAGLYALAGHWIWVVVWHAVWTGMAWLIAGEPRRVGALEVEKG